MDIVKINKIEKEFAIMTKRAMKKEEESDAPKKDEMRESRLLLLKDKTPALNRKNNQNLLSNLVLYHPLDETSGSKKNKKIVNIPQSNISGVSPLKHKNSDK